LRKRLRKVFKEQLLREILDYVEKKRKVYFTKEEFLIHLWYKYRNIRFETIIVQLRQLAREGFLIKSKRPIPEWGFTYYIVYYPVRSRIKAYLLRLEKQKQRSILVYSYEKR